MIVVSVQLWSARDGSKRELARMEICNDETGTQTLRNYIARALRGRDTKALNHRVTQRETRITRWPSERVHVWNLVTAALQRMGYGEASGAQMADLLGERPREEAAP